MRHSILAKKVQLDILTLSLSRYDWSSLDRRVNQMVSIFDCYLLNILFCSRINSQGWNWWDPGDHSLLRPWLDERRGAGVHQLVKTWSSRPFFEHEIVFLMLVFDVCKKPLLQVLVLRWLPCLSTTLILPILLERLQRGGQYFFGFFLIIQNQNNLNCLNNCQRGLKFCVASLWQAFQKACNVHKVFLQFYF